MAPRKTSVRGSSTRRGTTRKTRGKTKRYSLNYSRIYGSKKKKK